MEMMLDLSQSLKTWICTSGSQLTLVEGSEQQDLRLKLRYFYSPKWQGQSPEGKSLVLDFIRPLL